MSTGALLYPIGYIFLDDNGVPVNAGKLYSYRTGTSTAQDLYSDSTLDTAISNPVVLNSAGRATVPIYGASDTGFDYRLTLKTSADVSIWSYDDIVVDGADTATYEEGSFTGTLTGMDAATTGTVTYKIVRNSAGTGKVCHLSIAAAITGTSNTTAMTMTGLPAACTPTAQANFPCALNDTGNTHIGMGVIAAAGTTITFWTDATLSATGFTSSGAKGLMAGWNAVYAL